MSQVAPQDHEALEPVGPRPKFSDAKRARIFQANFGICYLCKTKIAVGEPWEVEHVNQRAISNDDSDRNLLPVHAGCHKPKTALDAKVRGHVNRMGFKHKTARKDWPATGPKMKSRPFPKRFSDGADDR